MNLFSIKSAASVCVAVAAMCFAGENTANAQFCGARGGFGGFGGSGVSIGYSSGFRGGGFGYGGYGGYGRGVSINVGRSYYPGRSIYYSRPYSGYYPGSFGRSYNYIPRGGSFYRGGYRRY